MIIKFIFTTCLVVCNVLAEDLKSQTCEDVREPAQTWAQFCQEVLHRECLLDSNSEPKCGQCSPGFQDMGSVDCRLLNEKCTDMKAPEKATLVGVCEGAVPGDICSFRCKTGFRLVGPTTLYCRKDMQWDEQPPTCKATLKCGDVVEGTKETWNDLCSKGKNMECLDNANDDPECICKDGFRPDDLGICIAA